MPNPVFLLDSSSSLLPFKLCDRKYLQLNSILVKEKDDYRPGEVVASLSTSNGVIISDGRYDTSFAIHSCHSLKAFNSCLLSSIVAKGFAVACYISYYPDVIRECFDSLSSLLSFFFTPA